MIPALTRRAAAGLVLLSTLAPAAWAQAVAPRVKFTTSAGEFVLELYPDKAPKTVENFLQYVRDGHYDNTIFHRVIDGFMIQGGGFKPDMQQKPTRTPIPLETRPELRNDRGTIAMARTANPNSATAQFFINVVDNKGLNAPQPDGYGYAVFGKVVSGMDVVDKIKGVPTGSRAGHQNVPTTPVVIQSATVLK
ncbi:MAG TPA: peptidylprolyl isomerase [Ramlibacter sp.]|nr:peptidylprolyl isomerase [Ramlibacter sp.]HYD76864.1 peptidylprolyl isomerase [Ramlibacter sp.]